jgi:hypothetical protein
MGPMNEFERRFLEMAQSHLYLHQANAGGAPPEYYGYPLQIGSATDQLADGVTHQGTIAIQADAWFLLQYVSVGVILSAASFGDVTQITDGGNLLIQITDTGAGEDIFAIAPGAVAPPAILVAGSPLAGAGGIPYVFPTPRLIPPNTNIQVSVTKFGASTPENRDPFGAYIMLNGARILVNPS